MLHIYRHLGPQYFYEFRLQLALFPLRADDIAPILGVIAKLLHVI
jgi:hypothetical protein